jgi:hypothetical protein
VAAGVDEERRRHQCDYAKRSQECHEQRAHRWSGNGCLRMRC